MATAAMAEAVDNSSNDGESCERRQRRWRKLQKVTQGQKKLQMCPSMVEEVAVLSLGGSRRCTRNR